MTKHLSERIQFNQVVAGVLRLIENSHLFRDLNPYINPKSFYPSDSSEQVENLRILLTLLKELEKEGSLNKFTHDFIQTQIPIKIVDQGKSLKVSQAYANWLMDDTIRAKINDDGSFESFLDYIRAQQVFAVAQEFGGHLQRNSITQAVNVINKALGNIASIGNYNKETLSDPLSIIESDSLERTFKRVLFLGNPLIDDMMGGFEQQTLNGFIAKTGGGKCLGKDTPILMYDGTIKKVQDVQVGDQLMGDDSKPRNVLSLARGRETMYKIVPHKGDPYIVNESHILTLFDNENEVLVDMSLREYLSKSPEELVFEKVGHPRSYPKYLTASTGVEFHVGDDLKMDPYLLGIWLGDGNSREPWITTMDTEVADFLHKSANKMGDQIKPLQCNNSGKATTYIFHNNNGCEFRKLLKSHNLLLNKHIPHEYKTASRENRLRLLAGIIDSDGYKHRNGNYEIATKYPTLARDILFLARSLGFAAFSYPMEKSSNGGKTYGNYLRISVIGDGSVIPVKLQRKQSNPRKSATRFLNYRFEIKKLGVDDYFGFEIDGNHRFLLGDFQITHNTMLSHHLIKRAVRQKMRVWVGVLEDRKKSFVYRIMSTLSGIPISRLKNQYKDLTSHEKEALKQADVDFNKFVKVDFLYGCDIDTIHQAALDYDSECRMREIEVPIVNIVDYTGHIAGRSIGDKMYEKIRAAYGARKDFVLKYNKIGFDFAQINREGSKNMSANHLITQNDLAGAYDLSHVFDNLFSINRGDDDILGNTAKLHGCKARDSAEGVTVQVNVDFSRATYHMDQWILHSTRHQEAVRVAERLKSEERSIKSTVDGSAGKNESPEDSKNVVKFSGKT